MAFVRSQAPARSAIVTGAARGIGRAIAARLAADGLDLTVCDLDGDGLDGLRCELADSSSAPPRIVVASSCDVRDADQVDALVDAHRQAHGGLDVMVANAGIAVTAPLLETTTEQWQQVFAVNVLGIAHCYRAAAAVMIDQGRGGRLIGAGSVAAHRGGRWQSAYSASKFAVRGLTQSAAQELAPHGITANLYSPGVVQTPMWDEIDRDMTDRAGEAAGSALMAMTAQIPLGRLETPGDVAGVVSFLASPDSAYVTGQSLVVDGGMWFS